MNKKIGKLFLIPNTLGDISPNKVMSLTIRDVIHSTHHFVFEKEKIGRAYIKRWCPKKSQSELAVQTLNKHTHLNKNYCRCSIHVFQDITWPLSRMLAVQG